MKAVLDRIENGIAVLLVEELKEEFTVNEATLPTGSKAGIWFNVEKVTNSFKIISIDEATTEKNIHKSASLMAKLQEKKKRSKFSN